MYDNMEELMKYVDGYDKKIQDFALSLYEDLFANIPDRKFTQQEISIMTSVLIANVTRNLNYQISTALFWKGKDENEEGESDE